MTSFTCIKRRDNKKVSRMTRHDTSWSWLAPVRVGVQEYGWENSTQRAGRSRHRFHRHAKRTQPKTPCYKKDVMLGYMCIVAVLGRRSPTFIVGSWWSLR